MKYFLFAPFFLINSSFSIASSQLIQIPVLPYDDKPSQVSYKVHNRCKRVKNYWKCVDRSNQKVTTSLDMDY